MEHNDNANPSNVTCFYSESSVQGPLFTLLVTICDKNDGGKITDLFIDRKAVCNFLVLGKGTANSKILNYLGLGQTEKAVLFSILPALRAQEMLDSIDSALDLKQPGHGIAFTLPLNGACMKDVIRVTHEKNGGDSVEQNFGHELIIAVINRGYNESVMDAARAAKASGGTILHARGFAMDGAEKFFGVTIQPDKEIVLILAESDKTGEIMRLIAEKAGVGTDVGAITFSLPVSSVRGLTKSAPE